MTIWIAWFTRGRQRDFHSASQSPAYPPPRPSPARGEGDFHGDQNFALPPRGGGLGGGCCRRATLEAGAPTPYFPSGAPAGWLTTCQVFLAGLHSVTTASLTSRPRCGTRSKS